MALTGSDLNQGSWKIVHDIVNGLSDAGSVYSKFPEEQGIYFPMTVLDTVETADGVETKTIMNTDINVPITMFNNSGKNLDVQSDAIINGLEGSRQAFIDSGIKLLNINNMGQGDNLYGNDVVHWKSLNINLVTLK